jgi:hypothetical protein
VSAAREKELMKKYGNGTYDPSAIYTSNKQEPIVERVRIKDKDEHKKSEARRIHASRDTSPVLSRAEIFKEKLRKAQLGLGGLQDVKVPAEPDNLQKSGITQRGRTERKAEAHQHDQSPSKSRSRDVSKGDKKEKKKKDKKDKKKHSKR